MANNLQSEINDFTNFLTATAYQAGDRLLIGIITPPQYTTLIPYTRVTQLQMIKPSMLGGYIAFGNSPSAVYSTCVRICYILYVFSRYLFPLLKTVQSRRAMSFLL